MHAQQSYSLIKTTTTATVSRPPITRKYPPPLPPAVVMPCLSKIYTPTRDEP